MFENWTNINFCDNKDRVDFTNILKQIHNLQISFKI